MLLTTLKQKTEIHHQRIQANLDLMNPDFEVADYRILLRRFFGYYAPWESAMMTFAPELLIGRSKLAGLMDDLHYLGEAESEAKPKLCNLLPLLNTRPTALGSMYVLEGATLGGQILRRHFAEKFGLNERGCTFFSGYGDRTGAMWKQFGDMLNTIPIEESEMAVDSAVATFNSMNMWLCGPSLTIPITGVRA